MDWDADQQRVLEHGSGPMLVTGPPGSGKTALLRERFARLIDQGADPERVVLLVLSRRAARDAREQIMRRFARSLSDLPVMTVHGFAFRVLGERFEDLGYAAPPQVLSAPEQYAFVRELLTGEASEEWPSFGHLLGAAGFARELADLCLRAQERLLSPEDLEALVQVSGREDYREVAGFYRRYLDALGSAGRADFAGLLSQTAAVLERDPSPGFDHVLVDDYQDATPATEAIVRALVARATSLVVAADPLGHVFTYKGGSLEPLRRIGSTFPALASVELPRSHRVDASMLAPLEHGEPLAEAPPAPPGVETRLLVHPGEEVEAVAEELLRARVDDDVPWDRMAVIVRRYGSYLPLLRHALGRHRVPFVVVAEAAAVASEPANRPIIDAFRYVWRPERRDELLEPLLVSPVGGLDPHALRRLRREARRRDVSLRELVESGPLPRDDDLRAAVERFREVLGELPKHDSPERAFYWLWSHLPAFGELVESGERQRDLDALAAMADVLGRFAERPMGGSVADYLTTLDAAEFGPDPWIPPEERRPGAVRVLSAHLAQGAEFDVVMVAGCLEGEFPSLGHREPVVDLGRLLEVKTGADRFRDLLVEERALFRLAISRAPRTVLFASESASARNPRTPSRFAERLGLTWAGPSGASAGLAASLGAMEASLRRSLADPAVPAADRLAALAALPDAGASPAEWWGGRDWTDPGIPLHPADREIHTSYSRLSSLQNCGLQYLYQAELGLDPESTHQMWLGSLVHRLIERVQKGELARDRDAVLAALDDAWEPARFPSHAIERQRYRDARTMLGNWLKGEKRAPDRFEEAFNIPIDGARLRGRIDAIFIGENGHARVVDYKTSRYAISQEAADDDLQLAAYYLAMKRAENLRDLGDPRLLELHYIFKSHQREAYAQRRVIPANQEGYEERAESTIKDLLAKVREEDFAPSPEADCQWCRFKSICPLWPEGAEVKT
ncbi:MAG TPA: ATP-dependent DNA helicase [Actinomycetota bacterium]